MNYVQVIRKFFANFEDFFLKKKFFDSSFYEKIQEFIKKSE